MADTVNDSRVSSANLRPSSRVPGPLLWAKLIVVLGALLTLLGAVLAVINPGMVSPHDEINGAVRIYAGYLASRNLAIATVLIVLLGLGARRALSQFMAFVALIQVFDIVMDLREARFTLVPGILVFAILFVLAANRLSGHSVWTRAAWRD